MASIVTTMAAGFSYSKLRIERGTNRTTGASITARPRRVVLVRAEAQPINPEIRKNEEKVVDNVDIAAISKPVTAYCRCWRSGTFPLCDGSHMKHNKATGDNVGPLLLKKPKGSI